MSVALSGNICVIYSPSVCSKVFGLESRWWRFWMTLRITGKEVGWPPCSRPWSWCSGHSSTRNQTRYEESDITGTSEGTNCFIVTQNLSDLSVCSGEHSPKVAHVETEEPKNRSDHLFSVLNIMNLKRHQRCYKLLQSLSANLNMLKAESVSDWLKMCVLLP